MSTIEQDIKTIYQGDLLQNEHLGDYTTWCVGGLVARMYKPLNRADLILSQKHANFIINHEESATTADIEALIHLVQTKVLVQTKIDLVYEVHIIGDC